MPVMSSYPAVFLRASTCRYGAEHYMLQGQEVICPIDGTPVAQVEIVAWVKQGAEFGFIATEVKTLTDVLMYCWLIIKR